MLRIMRGSAEPPFGIVKKWLSEAFPSEESGFDRCANFEVYFSASSSEILVNMNKARMGNMNKNVLIFCFDLAILIINQ